MKQTGVDSSIYFTNLKHNIKLIFGFQMSHEIGFSGKICFYTNLICHAKFSFTQLIFQHKVFSAKFGSGFNFKQIFSAIFSLIFLRKNRSEAFCVSSEKYIAVNVLWLKNCGVNATPSQHKYRQNFKFKKHASRYILKQPYF